MLINNLSLCLQTINMDKKIDTTSLVRVDTKLKDKVAKKLSGSRKSIGTFYDEAVQEKLKPAKK